MGQGRPFRQGRLVIEDKCPILEFGKITLQGGDQGVVRIEFKDRLALRSGLPSGLEDSLQIAPKVILISDQAGRRVSQSTAEGDILDLLFKDLLDLFKQ